MIALVIGILLMLFAVYAVLPVSWSLGWWPSVVEVIKGGLPIIALFIGLLALFIGIADLKDRAEAKKEEQDKQESQNS